MSNLTVTSLPYTHDLITHYQSFSDLPGFVLLESRDKQRGRYDIVTALPYETFKVSRHATTIPDAFNQLQSRLPKTFSESDLPFQGGAIGYFAYDLGSRLAGISSPVHSANDTPLINVGLYDWAIVTDHQLKKVNLVAAHFRPETATLLPEIQHRWEKPCVVCQTFSLQQAFTPLMSQEDYQQAFNAIHLELIRGRAYQVNYTQPFLGYYQGDAWEMYKQVRQVNPVPYSAFLRGQDEAILSFSPERFLLVDKGLALTSPIKGTAKRSSNPSEDNALRKALLACTKNRAENVMIVDLLRNDLGRFAKTGRVKVTALCELQSYNGVHHLVSNIEAHCKDNITPLQAFASCFPGGSITGAPKREAMRIISEHEPFARGIYCGSIAYLSAHGRMDSNIAIRTITAKDDTMYLSAGGGIVIDSNWEDEYRECFTKIAAIVNEISGRCTH